MEYVSHSWYEYSDGNEKAKHPWEGVTHPAYTGPKPTAVSEWLARWLPGFRDRVAAYATGFFFKDLQTVLPDAVAEARVYQPQGYRAMKMKIGLGSMRKDLDRILDHFCEDAEFVSPTMQLKGEFQNQTPYKL